MSSAAQAVRGFYSSLIAGESTGLMFMFGGPPKIDTPLDGNVEGSASLQRFVTDQKNWLASREAEIEDVALTENTKTAVAEIVLVLKQDGEKVRLPVALVGDLAGGMVTWLRIYHSTWPLTGSHKVRGPLMKRATRLGIPQTVKNYMVGIRKPDKAKVLSLFADNGYVREPSGSDYEFTGPGGARSVLFGGSRKRWHSSRPLLGHLRRFQVRDRVQLRYLGQRYTSASSRLCGLRDERRSADRRCPDLRRHHSATRTDFLNQS